MTKLQEVREQEWREVGLPRIDKITVTEGARLGGVGTSRTDNITEGEGTFGDILLPRIDKIDRIDKITRGGGSRI